MPLLAEARQLYARSGDPFESARAAIEQGMYAGCAGRTDEAVRLLGEGLAEFEHQERPRLAATGVYSLCVFLREKGDETSLKRARVLLWRHRRLFDDDYPDEALGLRRHWLRGRINVALGHRERAAPDLGWATAGFAFFGYPFPAAVAALDYAELFLEAGFTNQARTLVQRAVDILEPLGLPRDTQIRVLSLQRAFETDQPRPALRALLQRAMLDLEADPRADPAPVEALATGP